MGGGKGGADFNPKGKVTPKSCASARASCANSSGTSGPTRTSRGRHRRRRSGDRLSLRHVQAPHERVHGRSHRQGVGLGWIARPPRGHRLRCGLLRRQMLAARGDSLEGKSCLVSGSGNVAQHVIDKLQELGARPVSASDSSGSIYDEAGIDEQKLAFIKELKNLRRGRVARVRERYPTAVYFPPPPRSLLAAMGPQGRLRLSLRHPERNERGRRRQPGTKRECPAW